MLEQARAKFSMEYSWQISGHSDFQVDKGD